MTVCAADGRLQFHVVDVFTDRRYAGNALAVVLDGDQLTSTQRQAVAREFNLSETAFPVAPQTATADYSLKIHTPHVESPFGGHPSLGAAWLLVQQGRLAPGRFTQESGGATYALTLGEVEMLSTLEGPIPTVEQLVDASASLAAVNLTAADQVGLPAATVTAGAAFQVLAVRRDALRRLIARPDRLHRALDGASGIAVIVLTGARSEPESSRHMETRTPEQARQPLAWARSWWSTVSPHPKVGPTTRLRRALRSVAVASFTAPSTPSQASRPLRQSRGESRPS
jgi:PhzF family phenazine biosynthesis protein